MMLAPSFLFAAWCVPGRQCFSFSGLMIFRVVFRLGEELVRTVPTLNIRSANPVGSLKSGDFSKPSVFLVAGEDQ